MDSGPRRACWGESTKVHTRERREKEKTHDGVDTMMIMSSPGKEAAYIQETLLDNRVQYGKSGVFEEWVSASSLCQTYRENDSKKKETNGCVEGVLAPHGCG